MQSEHSHVAPLIVVIALLCLSVFLAWQAVRPVKRREERDGD